MKDTERRRKASFHRSIAYFIANAVNPPNAAATALIAQLTTTATNLDELVAKQDLAFGTVHGAVADRRRLKKDLVDFLKGLGETARVLDPDLYPGLAAEMRLGRSTNNYAALSARAHAAHTVLTDHKQAFVEHGSSATVDADLLALVTAFDATNTRRDDGVAVQIGGTAGIAALCKAGTAIVRKLDAILSKVYKADPGVLAGWKAARRVERNPVAATTPSPDEGGGTGGDGSGSTTPPPSGS